MHIVVTGGCSEISSGGPYFKISNKLVPGGTNLGVGVHFDRGITFTANLQTIAVHFSTASVPASEHKSGATCYVPCSKKSVSVLPATKRWTGPGNKARSEALFFQSIIVLL